MYLCPCRKDSKQSAYESVTSPTAIKLSKLDGSQEPAYDVINAAASEPQNVFLTPNPAYHTSTIKMNENPAYK